MADLSSEQYEQLPDFLKDDYKEVDGVYKHAGMMTVKETANNLDAELKSTKGQLTELSEKMSKFESDKATEIENAKAEALKTAKTDKDIEAIEKLYTEKMADLETRVTDRVRNETKNEMTKERAAEKADNMAKNIAAKLGVNDDAQADLYDLFKGRIKPSETGEIVFFNRDGSASTMTEKDFIEDAKKRHKSLVKADLTTTGGGLANGGGNGGNGGGRTAQDANQEKKMNEAKKNNNLNDYLAAAIKLEF